MALRCRRDKLLCGGAVQTRHIVGVVGGVAVLDVT